MNDTERLAEYKRRLHWLKKDAQTWLKHAREIKEYALPNHGRLLSGTDEEPNDGSKKHGSIYNGNASAAHRVLCAGIHNNLTSPILPWFLLTIDQKYLLEEEGVRAWLQDCTQIQTLAMAESNFYGAIFTIFEELAGFGTAALLVERPYMGQLRYRPLTFGEFFIALDEYGEANTLYRMVNMTVYELERRFGLSSMSTYSQELFRRKKIDERIKVVHVIQPRDAWEQRRAGPKGMPWESVYFEESESEKFLSESGYKTKPFAAPRWRVNSGDTYGSSPVMEILGDIKELQYLEKIKNQALSLHVQPPLNVPYSFRQQGGASLQPNSQNYYDGINPEAVRPTMQMGLDLRSVREEIAFVEERIRRFLFNDLFLQITERTERMTATEVRARQLERMTVIGPVVQQIMGTLLTPVIERTFDILWDARAFPPPPDTLQGIPYKIEYTGLLAQAQKATQTASIENMLYFIGQMTQVQAAQGAVDLLDKFDFDQAVDEIGESIGIPARIVRTDDHVEEIREARARAQQQAAMSQKMQEGMEPMANAAKIASEIPADGGKDSVLKMLMQQNLGAQ